MRVRRRVCECVWKSIWISFLCHFHIVCSYEEMLVVFVRIEEFQIHTVYSIFAFNSFWLRTAAVITRYVESEQKKKLILRIEFSFRGIEFRVTGDEVEKSHIFQSFMY